MTVDIDKELIIINDGSTDATGDKVGNIVKKHSESTIKILSHPKNLGKGAAIRTGLKYATGDAIIIQDADLEYDPNDYYRLIEPILKGETEVVFGSRLKGMKLKLFGKDATPLPSHYFANKFLSFLTNLLYGSNLTDMETCYKLLSKKVYSKLKLESNRFDIEPEITAKILKAGFRIKEIPITTKPRSYKEGKKIGWKDGLFAILTLMKYRL